MTPVCFTCEARLSLVPTEIAEQIFDISKWPDFKGYGPLPGIKSAEFEVRTPEVIGSWRFPLR